MPSDAPHEIVALLSEPFVTKSLHVKVVDFEAGVMHVELRT